MGRLSEKISLIDPSLFVVVYGVIVWAFLIGYVWWNNVHS